MRKDSWWRGILTEHELRRESKSRSNFPDFLQSILFFIFLNWSKLGKEQRERESAPEWCLGKRGLTNYTKVLLKAMLWIPTLSRCISTGSSNTHTQDRNLIFPQIKAAFFFSKACFCMGASQVYSYHLGNIQFPQSHTVPAYTYKKKKSLVNSL